MKRNVRIGIVLGAITLGIIAIGMVMQQGQKRLQAMQHEQMLKANTAVVSRGDVAIQVVETGSLEAQRTVEVKSQVGGRVARLLVDEGDYVKAGDLIAVIDPQQTELQVEQNRAQLEGAQSAVKRLQVEIEQRRVTARTHLERSRLRLKQLEIELKAQPALTSTAIRSAETAVANAQKAVDLLVNVTHPNARTAQEAALEDANNNLRQARIERDRQAGLYDRGYVSRRELEQAELNLSLAETRQRQAQEAIGRIGNEQRLEREQAQQRVIQARADLDRAKANAIIDDTKRQQYLSAQQDVRDAEVALKDIEALQQQKIGSEASVAQIRSSLNDSLRLLGETEVRAPIDGIVTKRSVQMGELVNALSSFSPGTPIVKIEDRSDMLVRLQINEIDVALLREGMQAKITVDALPGSEFSGRITKIAPAQIESATPGASADPVVKYEVEVTLNDVADELKSGMSAKCEMVAEEEKDVLIVPTAFVARDETGQHYVMMFDPNEKPVATQLGQPPTLKGKRQNVEVGLENAANIAIHSGVKEGDKLVRPPFTGPSRQGMMQFGPDDEEAESEEGGSDSQSGE